MFEQPISLNGDGDGMDGNIANVFASLFYYWCHNYVSTLSLFLYYNSYHVAFQFSGFDCGLPNVNGKTSLQKQ